jgi:4-diphosphocytidyl-2-C-methyl-D-erythritol kinase
VNEPAPAKVNLCLFLGQTRSDGRHELVTLFESISLADELELAVLQDAPDQVSCPGVEGPNLVSAALEALRREGWGGPPVRVEVRKRIPVAAGLGGGSADAAAALRLAHALCPLADGQAERVAGALGADVPSQLRPGLWLGTGAGENLAPVPSLAPHAFVIVPQAFPLSTADVYREADRLGLPRPAEDLAARARSLASAARAGAVLPGEVVVSDLERAAVSLAPSVSTALQDLREAGADQVLVCGSGPTVIGIYWGDGAFPRAAEGARRLSAGYPAAVPAEPITEPRRRLRHNGPDVEQPDDHLRGGSLPGCHRADGVLRPGPDSRGDRP